MQMNTYFQLLYNDALLTSKKMRGMGEYNWAEDWQRYSKRIYAYAMDYQKAEKYAKDCRARGIDKADPTLKLPLQPGNLSHGPNAEGETVRRQCTPLEYRRPVMYQGASIGGCGFQNRCTVKSSEDSEPFDMEAPGSVDFDSELE